MKSTGSSRNRTKGVDMPAEYQLDWSKAKPNPYAARLKDTVAVVLAPDGIATAETPPNKGLNLTKPAQH